MRALIRLLLIAALAVQAWAPAAMAAAEPDNSLHAWCGPGAPSAEAEAAIRDMLVATGQIDPVPASPHHDPLCALCCSALLMGLAVQSPAGFAEPVRYAARLEPRPEAHVRRAAALARAPNPPRAPPLV